MQNSLTPKKSNADAHGWHWKCFLWSPVRRLPTIDIEEPEDSILSPVKPVVRKFRSPFLQFLQLSPRKRNGRKDDQCIDTGNNHAQAISTLHFARRSVEDCDSKEGYRHKTVKVGREERGPIDDRPQADGDEF